MRLLVRRPLSRIGPKWAHPPSEDPSMEDVAFDSGPMASYVNHRDGLASPRRASLNRFPEGDRRL